MRYKYLFVLWAGLALVWVVLLNSCGQGDPMQSKRPSPAIRMSHNYAVHYELLFNHCPDEHQDDILREFELPPEFPHEDFGKYADGFCTRDYQWTILGNYTGAKDDRFTGRMDIAHQVKCLDKEYTCDVAYKLDGIRI